MNTTMPEREKVVRPVDRLPIRMQQAVRLLAAVVARKATDGNAAKG